MRLCNTYQSNNNNNNNNNNNKNINNIGWEEYIENESPWWNLWWQGKRYRKIDYESCKNYQRLNHISLPRNTWITKKVQ